MDIVSPLIQGLVQSVKTFASLPVFWFLAAAALLGAVCRLPVVKGWIGEWFVNLQARIFLPKRDYIMVANVTIPDGLGGTTQIDHVVVSRYGVFVVETKNMKGWIFGGEHDPQWTQKIHRGHSQRFQNPLRQNYKHTQALAGILGLPQDKVFSVIAFVGECKLKTRDKLPPSVRTDAGWVSFVREHRTAVLTAEEVAAVLERIEQSRLAPGFRTHREHVRYVKGLKESSAPPMSAVTPPVRMAAPVAAPATSPIPNPSPVMPPSTPVTSPLVAGSACPRCGGTLVTRTAKQGLNAGQTFLGCSAFPRCRFIG